MYNVFVFIWKLQGLHVQCTFLKLSLELSHFLKLHFNAQSVGFTLVSSNQKLQSDPKIMYLFLILLHILYTVYCVIQVLACVYNCKCCELAFLMLQELSKRVVCLACVPSDIASSRGLS